MLPTSKIDELHKTLKEFYEEVWHTKDGNIIPFSKVTHQHWSNIYWYHRYMFEVSEGQNPPFLGLGINDEPVYHIYFRDRYLELMDVAVRQLNLRFEGDLLEWVPIYENEKKWYKDQSTRKILIEKFKERIQLGSA